MRILGRQLRLSEIPQRIGDFTTMFFRSLAFHDALSLWSAYITVSNPTQDRFRLRDGYQIQLSKNPLDSLTVMVIFCRKEYGDVSPGSVVIDVGANVGIFALYAARCGARKVYALEPNKHSFELLVQNIKNNHLQDTIVPFNLAVGPVDGELVSIPKEPSPYNQTREGVTDEASHDVVESISLHTLIKKESIAKVDFLKMDCEGAEYKIIYSMNPEDLKVLTTLRVESHYAHERERLIRFMDDHGLKNTHEKYMILWFDRQ